MTVQVTNRAPISFCRCPTHDRMVGRDGEGTLLGRCSGCSAEAARAFRGLRKYPKRRLVIE